MAKHRDIPQIWSDSEYISLFSQEARKAIEDNLLLVWWDLEPANRLERWKKRHLPAWLLRWWAVNERFVEKEGRGLAEGEVIHVPRIGNVR